MEVLEGQNILVTISGKHDKIRVYYLSFLKTKVLKSEGVNTLTVGTHKLVAYVLLHVQIVKCHF